MDEACDGMQAENPLLLVTAYNRALRCKARVLWCARGRRQAWMTLR